MNTKKFRTRQEFVYRKHPKGNNYIIGLDAGYSSMKGYYEEGYFCFPSYVKKIGDSMLNFTGKRDIYYKDCETNELYIVGYTAQDMISSTDTNDTDGELYSRKRYNNKLFEILCNLAIGIALTGKTDDREIIVQTGLPTSYVKGDSMAMKKALSKPVKFQYKIGENPWVDINFQIKPDNIFIMPQPSGSLYSVLINNNGGYVKEAKSILFSNNLVMDVGFGTLDLYGIKNRNIVCEETIDNLGMREVLKNTTKKIFDEMDEDIRVQSLQKNLETGLVRVTNYDDLSTEDKDFSMLLSDANEMVFKEAIDRVVAITNAFRDYDRLIVTGGTGQAWIDYVKNHLRNMKTLDIVPGNVNDQLSYIYSNVRGYYLFRYKAVKKNK